MGLGIIPSMSASEGFSVFSIHSLLSDSRPVSRNSKAARICAIASALPLSTSSLRQLRPV